MEYSDETKERMRNSALLGTGVLGSLAAYEGWKHSNLDKLEKARVKGTRGWEDFIAQLQPGDIMFHRVPSEYSANADWRGREIPIKENELMKMVKGDPYYHSSVYKGKGLVTESGGMEDGVKVSRAWTGMPQEILAYRPKDKKQIPGALKHLEKSVGRQYADYPEVIKHALQHLAGVEPSSQVCRKVGGNTVCTELVAEAYPKMFPKTTMSPADMRHSKDLDLVARYGKTLPVSLREKVLTRGIYPVLKNLKYGAAAGLGAYGLSALMDASKGEEHYA